MGWFTNQKKAWEIKQIFILLGVVGAFSFLSLGVLTPVVIFIFGYQAKITKWIRAAVFIALFYLLILLIALFIYIAGVNPISLLTLNYVSFYIYTIYLAISVPEYLQRLDLKNYINLEKDKEYSYHSIMKQLSEMQSTVSPKQAFIVNLSVFKEQISNQNINECIDEIHRLVNVIIVNESNATNLVLERHIAIIESSLIQYIELSNSYHKSEQVLNSIKKLEELLQFVLIALENELSILIEDQVLRVDGEASVYMSVLKGRGLI